MLERVGALELLIDLRAVAVKLLRRVTSLIEVGDEREGKL